MAYIKALVRKIKWIGSIGLALQAVAVLLRNRSAALALTFFGLGLCFLALKTVYENSEARNKDFQLIPKN